MRARRLPPTLTIAPLLLLVACFGRQGADTDDSSPIAGDDTSAADAAIVQFEGAAPTNLIVITVDTLRRDRVGRYDGSGRTPNLDRLMGEGVVFDDHRSCSNFTPQGVTCAFSGGSPLEVGYQPATLIEDIPEDVPLLSDQLTAEGYRAALISTNGFTSAGTDYIRSFDPTLTAEGLAYSSADATEVVNLGLEFIEELMGGEEPWFIQLHFMDPHAPYEPPEEYLDALDGLPPLEYAIHKEDEINALTDIWDSIPQEDQELILEYLRIYYEATIAHFDDELGRMMDALQANGALDDTLVVIWSDHGEQFMDHGYFTHGRGLYMEENAAIAVFWTSPSVGIQPRAWTAPTTHADIVPTTLAAMGLEVKHPLDGIVVTEGAADPDRVRYAIRRNDPNMDDSNLLLERGGWRLQYGWTGEVELYDVSADPTESVDRLADEPELASELWDLLEPKVDELAESWPDLAPIKPDL